ncbi:hypothetical protein PR048_013310 [Dryococelus australis]|uniref:Uncharacterized protein n=1 Tax=Dryococelus australis TaxID=614101 RepID=A0ABQ9HSJ6_9NEOP|nr:hypothetical protein PR048_013310 [Dryococelus australis]
MAASQHNLLQLLASNFSNWKFRLECLLDEKQCKDVMKVEVTEKCKGVLPQDNKELLVKDARVPSIIMQCYNRSAHRNVFEQKSILSKSYVRRQFLSLKCKMGTDLEEHFQQFNRLMWDLEETGSKMDE